MDRWNIRQGAEVRSADSEKLGKVIGVQGQYLVVEKGFFFPTDYFVPTSAISSADDDTIYLSVTKDEALNSGWDQVPTTATGVGYADTATTRTDVGYAAGTTAADTGTTRGEYTATSEEALRVPVHEEELTATRRPTERGEVRIEKDVVAEDQVLEVPVTEERVRVTRRAVDREGTADDAAFQEGTIEVPVRGEEVDVQKRVRVAEEVDVVKEPVQRTERVEGTVRREQVRVEDDTVDTADA